MLPHPGVQPGEDMANEGVAMPGEPVMHPFPIPARLDQSGVSQLREMPRYLGLVDAEGAVQVANADFLVREQVQQTQTGWIGERFEKLFWRDGCRVLHGQTYTVQRICVSTNNMRAGASKFRGAQAASPQ